MTDLNGPPPPIEVKGNLAPDATWQTVRVVVIFGAGWAMSHFIESEAVIAAGIAMLTVLTTYGYGLLKLARTHFKMKTMASLLPDRQAVVKDASTRWPLLIVCVVGIAAGFLLTPLIARLLG